MDLGLSDKVAVVTGASKGIGLAVTNALARERVCVVAGARDITEELAGLAASAQVHPVSVDLTESDGPTRLVAEAISAYGRLDASSRPGDQVGGHHPHAHVTLEHLSHFTIDTGRGANWAVGGRPFSRRRGLHHRRLGRSQRQPTPKEAKDEKSDRFDLCDAGRQSGRDPGLGGSVRRPGVQVIADKHGHSDFGALQSRLTMARRQTENASRRMPSVVLVFDLLRWLETS